MQGGAQAEALREILEEMDNVWAAWRWAVDQKRVETVGECVAALGYVGEVRGWYQEGNQAFEEAASMLRPQLDAPDLDGEASSRVQAAVVLAAVLCEQGYLHNFMGRKRPAGLCWESLALLQDLDEDPRRDSITIRATLMLGQLLRISGDGSRGQQLLREAVAHAEETGDAWGSVNALYWLGVHAKSEGRYVEAEGLFQKAIAMEDEIGERFRKAGCLDNLSWIVYAQGDYDRAESLAQESLQISQEIGHRRCSAYAYVSLGRAAIGLEKYEQAKEHFRRGLAIADEIGDGHVKLGVFRGQSTLALALGQAEEAKRLSEDGFIIAREMGARSQRIGSLVGLGRAALALGQDQQARGCFRRALKAAMRTKRRMAPSELVGLAAVMASEGDSERAAELLGLVLHHSATCHVDRVRAQDLLSELESKLSPEALAAATARGQTRVLKEESAEILLEDADQSHH